MIPETVFKQVAEQLTASGINSWCDCRPRRAAHYPEHGIDGVSPRRYRDPDAVLKCAGCGRRYLRVDEVVNVEGVWLCHGCAPLEAM